MDVLRPTTWLLSLGLHAGILVAFVGFADNAALESGAGGDMVNVEQGIAVEGLTKLGEAEQVIETVDIPPVQEKVETQPVEQIKPELADAIIAKEGQHEEQIVPEEQKPKEEKPVEVPVQQQPAQVATLIEQSSGAAQHGGDTTEHRIYLGQLRKLLDDAAMASLERAAPFPPMPKSVSQEPLDVQVPFKFITR